MPSQHGYPTVTYLHFKTHPQQCAWMSLQGSSCTTHSGLCWRACVDGRHSGSRALSTFWTCGRMMGGHLCLYGRVLGSGISDVYRDIHPFATLTRIHFHICLIPTSPPLQDNLPKLQSLLNCTGHDLLHNFCLLLTTWPNCYRFINHWCIYQMGMTNEI
jgi:hypothetical protein